MTAREFGEPYRLASLTFCQEGEGLCQLFFDFTPASTQPELWHMQLRRVSAFLAQRFGIPDVERSEVPKGCEEQLHRCLAEGRAYINAAWRWEDGTRVTLGMHGNATAGVQPFLAVTYINAAGAAQSP